MKLYLSPEDNGSCCNCFAPKYYFAAEWCLDMHGFLDRDELEKRIDEINDVVAKNPLFSAVHFLCLCVSYNTCDYNSYRIFLHVLLCQ